MELNSKQKGNLTELQCITYFYQLGYQCSLPYGENSRYDFIVDINNKLFRIQVKTSSLKKNSSDAIEFSCRSTRVNSQGSISKRYTEDEIDFFATFWEGKCYLIPQKECSVTKTLRFELPKNGRITGISFAKDYEVENQIKKILEGGSN